MPLFQGLMEGLRFWDFVTDEYKVEFKPHDRDEIIKFLCERKRDKGVWKVKRKIVEGALNWLESASENTDRNHGIDTMLDEFFNSQQDEEEEEPKKTDKAWNKMGFAYHKLGKYKKAIECYKEVLEIDPKNISAWHDMGFAYHKLGKYKKAIKCYKEVLKIKPECIWTKDQMILTFEELGAVYRKSGEYDNAIEYFQEALKIDPKRAETWLNMGNVYLDKAFECLDRTLTLNPLDSTLKRFLEELNRCRAEQDRLWAYLNRLWANLNRNEAN